MQITHKSRKRIAKYTQISQNITPNLRTNYAQITQNYAHCAQITQHLRTSYAQITWIFRNNNAAYATITQIKHKLSTNLAMKITASWN